MTFVEWLRQLLTNASFWFTVRPWEQGVRLTRGKKRVKLGPGLYFKFPVIHHVLIFPIRLRTVYVPMQTLRSSDGRTVLVGLILKYKIHDIFMVLDTLHNPESTMAHLAQGAVGRLVPTKTASEINADVLANAVRETLTPEIYGISDFDVLVSDAADLSNRTYRMISESRWFSSESEIDKQVRG